MKSCLAVVGVLALLVVVVLVGGTLFVGCRATEFAQTMQAALDDLHDTNREFPFDPAEAAAAPERFDSWLAVREEALAIVAPALAELEALEDAADEGGMAAFKAAWQAFRGAVAAARRTPEALAAALREHRMSLDEYAWSTQRAHAALVAAARAGDPKAKQIVERLETRWDGKRQGPAEDTPNYRKFVNDIQVDPTAIDEGFQRQVLAAAEPLFGADAAVLFDMMAVGFAERAEERAEGEAGTPPVPAPEAEAPPR